MNNDAFDDLLTGLTGEQRDEAREALLSLEQARRDAALVEGRRVRALAVLARLADAQADGSSNSHARADARRSLAAEAACALRVAPSEARNEMNLADTLDHDYPKTLASLTDGRISLAHAGHVAAAGGALDAHARASLDDHAPAHAETRTSREFAKIVKKQVADLDTRSLKERHDAERARRYISVRAGDYGMSLTQIYAPTVETRAILDILDSRAHAIRRDRLRAMREYEREHGALPDGEWTSPESGRGEITNPLEIAATDNRTLMQIRVDLLQDVLLTAEPTGHELAASGTGTTLDQIRPTVHITIPVDQLLDPDRGSGWLENGELASPDTLRILAGRAAGWERLFIRPEDGTIAAADHYRPTAAQKRALLARDMTCRIPGCETTARKCDIDHGHDYALGGRTSLDNLESLCPGHHQMKHQTGWRVRQRAGGVIEFTTPLGRITTDEPISRVFFRETPPRVDTARTDADARVQQFLADRGDNKFAQLQREAIRGRQARFADMRRREREIAALGTDPEGERTDDAASDVERDLSWFDDPRALRLEQRWDETFLERLESGLLVGA
ncbi:MAG: DUF222 domain-containing protein [Microbacterium gubbeenense]